MGLQRPVLPAGALCAHAPALDVAHPPRRLPGDHAARQRTRSGRGRLDLSRVVTALIGELRRRRRLTVPTFSAITDLAGLYFWAHPGIDLHFVTHPESIEEVERIAGRGSAEWARPPNSPDFLVPRPRAAAREALGLPGDARSCSSPAAAGVSAISRVRSAPHSRRGHDRHLSLRPQRRPSGAARAPLPRRAPSAAGRVHGPDGRHARGRGRARAFDRRPDGARGDHQRLPGGLLRLPGRPRGREQPCVRAVRPRPNRRAPKPS